MIFGKRQALEKPIRPFPEGWGSEILGKKPVPQPLSAP
jgi:hypothetical protein